jgi:hypothetical protein
LPYEHVSVCRQVPKKEIDEKAEEQKRERGRER